jgi:hypothetical protein
VTLDSSEQIPHQLPDYVILGSSSKIWPMYLGLLGRYRPYISVEYTIVMRRGVVPIYKEKEEEEKGIPVN